MRIDTRSSTGASVPGKYLCGDNARCDADGYYWIMGRIDDVLNVSGHRLEYDRNRKRAGQSSGCCRGGCRGTTGRTQRRSHCCLCHLGQCGTRARKPAPRSSSTSVKRSVHWPNPTTSTSLDRYCRKPEAEKSCGDCFATSPVARKQLGDTSTLEDYSVLAKLREDDES